MQDDELLPHFPQGLHRQLASKDLSNHSLIQAIVLSHLQEIVSDHLRARLRFSAVPSNHPR